MRLTSSLAILAELPRERLDDELGVVELLAVERHPRTLAGERTPRKLVVRHVLEILSHCNYCYEISTKLHAAITQGAYRDIRAI